MVLEILPSIKMKQADTELYVAAIPAKYLKEYTKADVFDHKANTEGYQRSENQNRVEEICQYFLGNDKEAFNERLMPTGVVLSARGPIYFDEWDAGNSHSMPIGKLTIPDESLKLKRIDGNHRLKGLEKAMEREPELEDYPLASVIIPFGDKNPRYQEMRQFYVHNNRAKSVPTDLVKSFLIKIYEQEGKIKLKNAPDMMAHAVSKYLNESKDGPWRGRIQIANEPKRARCLIGEKSMDIALKECFKTPEIKEVVEKAVESVESKTEQPEQDKASRIEKLNKTSRMIAEIVDNYWKAIGKLCPEAFGNPKEYVLVKTTGVYSLSALFPSVFSRCSGDYSEDRMLEFLRKTGMNSEFWRRGSPKVEGKSGWAGCRAIARELRNRLPRPRIEGLM